MTLKYTNVKWTRTIEGELPISNVKNGNSDGSIAYGQLSNSIDLPPIKDGIYKLTNLINKIFPIV